MQSQFLAPHREAINQLVQLADQSGCKLFVVGGMVRDLLRGAKLTDPDLDVVVEGNALDFATRIHPVIGGKLRKFPDFFTAKIVAPFAGAAFAELDFASTRTETYSHPGALPTVALASLAEDLGRRDFSVNAMAVTLNDFMECVAGRCTPQTIPVVDLFRGRADLYSRTIRTLHPLSFADDPTRLFRACRYLARLSATLAPETAADFSAALTQGALGTISRFRVATELKKIYLDKAAPLALQSAHSLGLLAAIDLVPPSQLASLVGILQNPPRPVQDGTEIEKLNFLLSALTAAGGASITEHFGVSKKILKEIQQCVNLCSSAALGDLSLAQRAIRSLICSAQNAAASTPPNGTKENL